MIMQNIIFEISTKSFLSIRKSRQDFLLQVFGKEKCSLLAAWSSSFHRHRLTKMYKFTADDVATEFEPRSSDSAGGETYIDIYTLRGNNYREKNWSEL